MKVEKVQKSRNLRNLILSMSVIACLAGAFHSCNMLKGMTGTQTVCNGNPCITMGDYSIEILEVKGDRKTQMVQVVVIAKEKNGGSRIIGDKRTVAVDDKGVTSAQNRENTYGIQITSSGTKIMLNPIGPVSSGATLFKTLNIGYNNLESLLFKFKDIPIVWEN